MTIRGYSNAFVDVMLGWLKGLANWVLRLFNLAGSVSGSPLLWLSKNWLKLLIFFLALGIILDRLIWLIRWRPYWVWFRKERVIVNDDRFFVNADIDKASDWEGDLESNWDEHDYVVASTVVKRRSGERRGASAQRGDGRSSGRHERGPRRRTEGTKVRRHVPEREEESSRRDGTASGKRHQEGERADDAARRHEKRRSPDTIFSEELREREVSDSYEDEVFNVSNLPVFDEFDAGKKPRAKSRNRRR